MIHAEAWYKVGGITQEVQELARELLRSDPSFEDPRIQRMIDLVDRLGGTSPGLPPQFYTLLVDHVLDGFEFSHFEDFRLWVRAMAAARDEGLKGPLVWSPHLSESPLGVLDNLRIKASEVLEISSILPHPQEWHAWVCINSIRVIRQQWFKYYAEVFHKAIIDYKVKHHTEKEAIEAHRSAYPNLEGELRKIREDMDTYSPPVGRVHPQGWEWVRGRVKALLDQFVRWGHITDNYLPGVDYVRQYYKDVVKPAIIVRDRNREQTLRDEI